NSIIFSLFFLSVVVQYVPHSPACIDRPSAEEEIHWHCAYNAYHPAEDPSEENPRPGNENGEQREPKERAKIRPLWPVFTTSIRVPIVRDPDQRAISFERF